MSLGTDILNLRRNKLSSVAALIGGIERLAEASSDLTALTRKYALYELGDAVLNNVAVYAVEFCWGDTPLPKRRRASMPKRWTRRHADTGLYQRQLFA
jgi:hypothetical protein